MSSPLPASLPHAPQPPHDGQDPVAVDPAGRQPVVDGALRMLACCSADQGTQELGFGFVTLLGQLTQRVPISMAGAKEDVKCHPALPLTGASRWSSPGHP